MMAQPAVQTQPLTFADAAALDPDLFPGEVVEGERMEASRNPRRPAEIAGNVSALRRRYARSHLKWRAGTGESGTSLQRDRDTLRGPDAALIRGDRRLTDRSAEGRLERAPDVAAEASGTARRRHNRRRRRWSTWRAAPMVWVREPEPQLRMLFTPPGQIRLLGTDDILDGADALPGFSCKVSEFFE